MKLNLFILVAFIAVALALIVWAFAKSQNTNPHRRQKIGNINRSFFRRHMRKVYLAPLFVEKFAAWLGLVREPVGSVQFANVGEGVHEHGIKSYIPDAATASRYYLYQVGSTADNVAVAAGTNEPLGPSDDLADSAALDLAIGIKLLGAYKGTTRMISDGTVTNGARVCASKANPGQITVPGGGAGTFWVVGKAIVPTDANIAAGDPVEVIPFQPVQVAY